MKTNLIIVVCILLLLTSCNKGSLFPTAENYSAAQETTLNQSINETNTNESIEEIIPYNEKLAIYLKEGSTIVRYENKTVLIDAGYEANSQKLLQDLKNLGVETIDYLIISNTNKKRIEGTPYIILKTNPKKVFDSGIRNLNTELYEQVYNKSEIVSYDDIFVINDLMVYLLVPYDDGGGLRDNEDSNSIVVRLYYNGFSIMFMSDCDYDCEGRIGSWDSKVLVASENCESTSLLFLQKVNPEIVVMPKECENIRKRINNLNIPINPKVTIVSDGAGFEVK
jgi:competence protein ComEC